jgi:hypothetical protein
VSPAVWVSSPRSVTGLPVRGRRSRHPPRRELCVDVVVECERPSATSWSAASEATALLIEAAWNRSSAVAGARRPRRPARRHAPRPLRPESTTATLTAGTPERPHPLATWRPCTAAPADAHHAAGGRARAVGTGRRIGSGVRRARRCARRHARLRDGRGGHGVVVSVPTARDDSGERIGRVG